MVTTTENKQVTINIGFQASKRTWLTLAGAGAMLVAAVLASVTLGIGWGTFTTEISGGFGSTPAIQSTYELFEATSAGGSSEYTDDSLDGHDGIGLVRAAGPLAIVGVVLAYVGALVMAASVFVQRLGLPIIAPIVAALAVVFLVLTVVLFPIGISDLHEAGTQSQGGVTFTTSAITWGAGLVLAIIAATVGIAGTVLGFLCLRRGVVQ